MKMIEQVVNELKSKTEYVKEMSENNTDPKTKESKINSIRRLTEDIKTLKVKAKKDFLSESQIYLVKTPTDYSENKDKLKNGFIVELTGLAFDTSERLVPAVVYQNGVKQGYQMSSLLSLVSQEVRKLLVDVGFDGRDVPKILGLKNSRTSHTREELTDEVFRVIKHSCEDERKDFEELVFEYSIKELSNWLVSQDSFSAKNKILVIVSPYIDNKLIKYFQMKTGKAVTTVTADNLQVTLDTIKKSLKISA